MKILIRCLWLSLCAVVLLGFEAPAKRDRQFYERTGEIVWEVHTVDKKIALTFDDGPDPVKTEKILDMLKQYNAKATFFVLGNKVERYSKTIKRELDEGHEVANHTYNHVYFNRSVNPVTVRDEIVKTQKVLEKVTGRKSALFRPPGGYYNDRSVDVTKSLGYTTILWSWHQDTNDWRRPGVDYIVNKVLNNARNGDIVLMHDYNPGSDQTVEAVSIILPKLAERGFQFVTVSELMQSDKTIPITK